VFTGYACPFCGLPVGAVLYPPAAPAGSGLRSVGSVFWSIALVLFFVLLAADMATLAYASGLVVNGSLAGGPRFIDLYVLAPYPVGFSVDAPAAVFVAYFLFLVVAIVASYVWYGYKDGRATVQAFRRPIAELRPRLESRSGFLTTGQVFLAVLAFQAIYLFALFLAGYEPFVPEFPGNIPEWYIYYALANASVYEELVTRLLFVGIPLAAGALLVRPPPAGPRVAAWRHLFGGTITRDSPRGLVSFAVFLVFASAVVFGLAHVPAWGWWKFPPTFVAGIALGYVFVRCGLLAAIMFHFATDYLGAMAILTADSLGAQILLGLFLLVLIAFGLLFIGWYTVYAARLSAHLVRLWLPKPVVAAPALAASPSPYYAAPAGPPAPPAPPPPVGTASYGYTCRRCGWREARYADGRFTCLRCGSTTP
jgi:hypothetical protein